jgi:hypothetical protein
MAMPEEYAIVRDAGITVPNIVYFLSRSVLFDGCTVLQVLIWYVNMARVGTFGFSLGSFLTGKCILCVVKVDRLTYILS